MAIRKAINMMTHTNTKWNLIGEPVRAGSFYGYSNSVHTVQIIYQNFVGGWGLQGTLAVEPKPEDWFWIKLNPNGDMNTPYLTFPENQLAPTGNNGGDTGSMATTFMGNFVHLRSILVRDYLQPVPVNPAWNTWTYGQIDTVLLSL